VHSSFSSLPSWALAVIVVVGAAEVVLDVVALVDLYRRPASRVVTGNKWVWVAIVLLVNMVGAILYLAVGRTPAPAPDAGATQRPPRERMEGIADELYGPREDDTGRPR
jgi:Phospholipase_D-nuclease N-terminal